MANEEHLAILRQGVDTWNKWRNQHYRPQPDLSQANLSGAWLSEANLSWVNFSEADLGEADLGEAVLGGAQLDNANLSHANLSKADLADVNMHNADLSYANLSEAAPMGAYLSSSDLSYANLNGAILVNASLTNANLYNANLKNASLIAANLSGANLSRADLSGADLSMANLSNSNLSEANLSGAKLSLAVLVLANLAGTNLARCNIYGISVWDANLEGAIQKDLVITRKNQPTITVDNIEVAQFIYMLINNEKLRDVIDTITGKAVLILERFTPERKPILDALREHLRKRNYIPILFDFEKPDSRSLTETVITLAHLSRFVIADLTDPSSIPHELMSFVPKLKSVAVQPIILREHRPYAMFEDLQGYNWVLPIHEYESQDTLISELVDKIIVPAEEKVKQLRPGGAV